MRGTYTRWICGVFKDFNLRFRARTIRPPGLCDKEMRIARPKWILLVFIGVLCVDESHGWALKCDRIPDGAGATKSPADGRFRIRIQGNLERYNPSEVYTSALASDLLRS